MPPAAAVPAGTGEAGAGVFEDPPPADAVGAGRGDGIATRCFGLACAGGTYGRLGWPNRCDAELDAAA